MEVSLMFSELGIQVLPFDADATLLRSRFRTATQKSGLGLGEQCANHNLFC